MGVVGVILADFNEWFFCLGGTLAIGRPRVNSITSQGICDIVRIRTWTKSFIILLPADSSPAINEMY